MQRICGETQTLPWKEGRSGEMEMITVSLKRLAGVLGLLVLAVSAFGQAPAAESPINLKMRQKDRRLDTPVSFSADRIYLGELLEALSAKTGVALSMDNTDNFSGILIACDLKQTPLADVMNSVWSLIGSKSGLWVWKADTRQSPIRYSLSPTLNARNLGERLHQAMQERFEAQTALLMRLAFMPPEERKAHAEDLRTLVRSEDPRLAEQELKADLANEDIWAVMRLFGTLLSADQRKRVLNGEKIDIPLDSLPEDQRQSALALEEGRSLRLRQWQVQAGAPLHERQKEPTESITFGGAGQRNYWMVTVGFTSKHRISAGGTFGISTDLLASDVFADWILPGDVRKLEVETHLIAALPTFKPEEVWSRVPGLDYNIAAAATTEGVSFIAVVPEHPTDGDVPLMTPGKTPGDYFSAMWNGKMLMHKWRDGILLAHYPQWFCGDEALCSYGLVKRLRSSLQKQEGLLSLEDIAEPATSLSAAQLSHFTEEFPYLGAQISSTDDIRAQKSAALCAFYRRYPKALSERGLLMDLKMRAFLQDPILWPKWFKLGEDVTAVRIVDVPSRLVVGIHHTYTLQMTTSTQKWRDVASFDVVRIAPKIEP